MGYDFVALSHETGGHLAEETDEFFQQLVNHAGGGDPSDEARFRHYAATRLHLTNQIGVAKTVLAHLPVTSTSRRRIRPLLGYAPLHPPSPRVRLPGYEGRLYPIAPFERKKDFRERRPHSKLDGAAGPRKLQPANCGRGEQLPLDRPENF